MGPLISQLSENLDDRWIWGSSLVILTVFVFVTLYRQALPKFYPDIPHHPDAKGRLLGDLPSLIAHAKQSGGQVTDWMSLQCVELNSPIIQVAIKPFSPPFVIVDDHTTNEDILTKRTAAREFDRGQDSTDFFGHVMPDASIVMKSNERFRSQRHMWAGTMSPSFLNDIAAPHMHAIFSKLVKLWTRKSKLAAGHPFEAADDLKLSTLDVIWAIVHGTELGSVQSQIDFLSSQDPRSQGADLDTAVFLPRAEMPPLANALQYLVNSTTPRNLFPTIRKYYMYCRPDFRAAWKIKEQSVGKLLQTSRDKFLGEKRQGPSSISCAMDYVIGKEGAASEKAGQIVMDDRSMKDETFMMLLGVGGHMSKFIGFAYRVTGS